MKKLTFAFIAFLGLGTVGAFAQDDKDDTHDVTIVIPEVAILDIESLLSKNFNFAFKPDGTAAIGEAGKGLIADPGNNVPALWLNYTSVVTGPGGADPTRNISVFASSVVPGVTMKVTAGAPIITTGGGTPGTPTAQVTIGLGPLASATPIITGIGSVFTGDGVGAGSPLTYAIDVPAASFGSLVAGSTTVTLTYTLSDNI